MSFRSSHRRVSLRTAVAAAALGGAVLAPATAAFADTVPATPAVQGQQATGKGTLIRTDALKGGLTAKVYKHGDQHIYYTATVLDGAKELGVLTAGGGYASEDSKVFGNGVKVTLDLTGAVTSVVDAGSDGQGPVTPVECVATVTKSIGAGTLAELSTGPSGPSVVFQGSDGKVVGQLSRLHPKLPASAGFLGEIINPSSTAPQLRTNMEGGGHPASVTDFPKLPKGCSFTYTTTSGTGSSANGSSGTGSSANGSSGTGSSANGTSGTGSSANGSSANGTETQTSQTSVVPKGSVAAGAEIEQNGSPVLIAVGGAAAVGAAGLGFVLMRRRAAVSGR
ncbi:hypothetical protein [Streptomyces sp. NPDC096323]|uniref:hypothetical protein n=1 Tax=Streptomyces sp. NPDC096323 TaxID=3155822 RepID=UPI00331E5669